MNELTSKIKASILVAEALLKNREVGTKVFSHMSRVRFDYENYTLHDKLDIINENIAHLNKAIRLVDEKLNNEPMLTIDGVCIIKANSELREARRLLIRAEGIYEGINYEDEFTEVQPDFHEDGTVTLENAANSYEGEN